MESTDKIQAREVTENGARDAGVTRKCGTNDGSDLPTVTLYLGNAEWHDGPGWYYAIDEYPDEGSSGSFATRDEAAAHARADGFRISEAIGDETNKSEPTDTDVTRKLDLDELERRIRSDHNARLSRAQTLALIARIREIEKLADMVIDKYEDGLGLITDDERAECARWHALIAKGAVLP